MDLGLYRGTRIKGLDLLFVRPWIYELGPGHFQVGSYRYRSLIEGLYTF